MINPDEAPEGFKAREYTSCRECAFFMDYRLCLSASTCCTSMSRSDKENVTFMKKAEIPFLNTAKARKTSPEIMRAILEVAGGDEARALAIWGDPDEESFLEIYSIVTCQGMIDSRSFTWGDHGNQWGYQ